ncbi:hypothetical protein [Vibrio sp. Isolate30]|uniref:tetratricopeptide repeat protein n=1 Tax=Vibrio sp. Isolate30 TaxID=2908536 RepID=UPI001EFE6727|nr:hypothetical protein [Vibrio sp. Isolate30]MCG9631155.1 hypothetical protein [Vibrio sp. Isolate30]
MARGKHRHSWAKGVCCIVGIVACFTSQVVVAASSASSQNYSNQASAASGHREQLLAEYSQDETLELEQRAAATVNLGMHYGPNAIIAVARASRSTDVEMRLAAIQAADQWQGKAKWDVVAPLLNDDNVLVQKEAVRTLIVLWPELKGDYLDILTSAVERHLSRLPMDIDGDLERAWIYNIRSERQKATDLYFAMQNRYHDPRVSIVYADFLKKSGKESEGIRVLNQALIEFPNSAALHYSLGLAYLRADKRHEALGELRSAYELEPNRGSYGYIYATLIRDEDPKAAASIYRSIYQHRAQPAYLYALCETLLLDGQDATLCLNELQSVAPSDVVSQLKNLSQSK